MHRPALALDCPTLALHRLTFVMHRPALALDCPTLALHRLTFVMHRPALALDRYNALPVAPAIETIPVDRPVSLAIR
jgi:hypothetical protein